VEPDSNVLFEPLGPSAPLRMGGRPTSPVGPNLSALSATSLSCHEMVGLTTNAEVRRTESEVGISTLYARVHAVPVSSDEMLGRTGNATAVDRDLIVTLSAIPSCLQTKADSAVGAVVVKATGQALEPDSDALFAAPQPSIEQADNAVVYTEAMTPLVQMLCRESLNGSGRSEAARANKRARERERKQRKKARKALQLAAPEEILSRASLLGGVRASRKRRKKTAGAVAARVATRPIQPIL
jgi:hypothetical protein